MKKRTWQHQIWFDFHSKRIFYYQINYLGIYWIIVRLCWNKSVRHLNSKDSDKRFNECTFWFSIDGDSDSNAERERSLQTWNVRKKEISSNIKTKRENVSNIEFFDSKTRKVRFINRKRNGRHKFGKTMSWMKTSFNSNFSQYFIYDEISASVKHRYDDNTLLCL